MHARKKIPTNGSFKDGIEIEMKWVAGWFDMEGFLAFIVVVSKF